MTPPKWDLLLICMHNCSRQLSLPESHLLCTVGYHIANAPSACLMHHESQFWIESRPNRYSLFSYCSLLGNIVCHLFTCHTQGVRYETNPGMISVYGWMAVDSVQTSHHFIKGREHLSVSVDIWEMAWNPFPTNTQEESIRWASRTIVCWNRLVDNDPNFPNPERLEALSSFTNKRNKILVD